MDSSYRAFGEIAMRQQRIQTETNHTNPEAADSSAPLRTVLRI